MPDVEFIHLSESGLTSQRFSHKKTGEIVTEIPLSAIEDYEQYDGPGCYYSAAKNVVIDLVNDLTGLTVYSKRSRTKILAEYPDAELLTLNEATERHQKPFIEPVSEITEEKFWYWLEVLFPEDWQHSGGESFKVCERICGDITQICCALNDHNPDTKAPRQRRYFALCDSYKTPHREILKRCREYMRANP